MNKFPFLAPIAAIMLFAGALALQACSPTYDWREVRGSGAPFVVVMPAKPTIYVRPVNLDGVQITMTMTAAEVRDTTFAVGTSELPDAKMAPIALQAMKTALVRNINGAVRQEKSSAGSTGLATIDIEAAGSAGGQPRMLFARFVANDRKIYQIVVLGPEKIITRDLVDTFFTSFKID